MSRASLAQGVAARLALGGLPAGAPVVCFCGVRGYVPVRLVDPQPITPASASTGGGAVECPCRKRGAR